MDEQTRGQAATLDLRRDMSRDGIRRDDAQLGQVHGRWCHGEFSTCRQDIF